MSNVRNVITTVALAFLTWVTISVLDLREWKAAHAAWGEERALHISQQLDRIEERLQRVEVKVNQIQIEARKEPQ